MLKRLLTIPLFMLFIFANVYWYVNHKELDIYKQMIIVLVSLSVYLVAAAIEVFYAKDNHIRIIMFKTFTTILLLYYCAFLSAVLFLDGYFFSRSQESYVNKVPFHTIKQFFNTMRYNNDLKAFGNLVGNAILFAPMGLLLPLFHKAFRRIWIFLPTVIIMVSGVEYLQHRFSIGGADVDDIILNVVGAMIVYFVYKFIYFLSKDKLEMYFKDDYQKINEIKENDSIN